MRPQKILRDIGADDDQVERIHDVCRALGLSYKEFVLHSTMQACDEMEGVAREARRYPERPRSSRQA